jgi:hypothetical protein
MTTQARDTVSSSQSSELLESIQGVGGEESRSERMLVDSEPPGDSVPFVSFPAIPRDFVDSTFLERSRGALVGELAPPLHSLVIARSTESVASVFKKVRFKVLRPECLIFNMSPAAN